MYNSKDQGDFFIEKHEIEKTEDCSAYTNFTAFDAKGEEIGFLNYAIKQRIAWLYRIEITERKYLSQGVGHCLIAEFEQDLRDKGISRIQGKYYPCGIGSHLTKNFYERHGYELVCYDQGDWEISKTLKPENKKEDARNF